MISLPLPSLILLLLLIHCSNGSDTNAVCFCAIEFGVFVCECARLVCCQFILISAWNPIHCVCVRVLVAATDSFSLLYFAWLFIDWQSGQKSMPSHFNWSLVVTSFLVWLSVFRWQFENGNWQERVSIFVYFSFLHTMMAAYVCLCVRLCCALVRHGSKCLLFVVHYDRVH